MIRRVQQEHKSGCMVAVLAMLMNISYFEALAYFPCNPDSCGGFSSFVLDTILVDQGYAVARKYKHRTGFGHDRYLWPPMAFGPIHWCEVNVAAGSHAVLMLEDGTVLDPWNSDRTSLMHQDYLSVNFVAAITKF